MNYIAYMEGNPPAGGPPGMRSEATEGGPFRPAGFNRPHGPPPGRDDGETAGRGPNRNSPPGAGRGGGPGADPGPPGMRETPVGGASAGMAIHKSEGVVPVNDQCESTIPGLYAAGDALGSYMTGAIYTQIGSSLTGSAVQGAAAGYSQEFASHRSSEVVVVPHC